MTKSKRCDIITKSPESDELKSSLKIEQYKNELTLPCRFFGRDVEVEKQEKFWINTDCVNLINVSVYLNQD